MGFDKVSKDLFDRYKLIKEADYIDPKDYKGGRYVNGMYVPYPDGFEGLATRAIDTVVGKPLDAAYNAAKGAYNYLTSPSQPQATQQTQNSQPTPAKAQPQQTEQPITPTKINYNNPGFDTSSIDKAAQSVLQKNPNFNVDMITKQFKDNIKANIDTLASIGMSEAEIQKRIAPEIQRMASLIPQYANTPNYQRQDTQQNVTGRSIQQVYGIPQNQQYKNPFNPQGQRFNPPSQTPSQVTQSLPQQQANNTQPFYKKPYNQQSFTATKSY